MKRSKTGLVSNSGRALRAWGALCGLSGAFLSVVMGCGKSRSEPPIVAVPQPVVQVARSERRTLQRTVDLPGTVEPYQQAMLYAKVAGYLHTVSVDKGDRVRVGQLLATIDSPEMQREAAQAHETALGARALSEGNAATHTHSVNEYRQTQAAVAKAQADAFAWETQIKKAQAEREVAAAEYQKAVEQEKAARAAVGQAQAAFTQTQAEQALQRQTYARLKRVYDRDPGLLARQDLDIAQTRMQESESKVMAAEQGVDLAKQGLAAAQQGTKAAQSKHDAAESGITTAKAQAYAAQKQVETARAHSASAKSEIGVVDAQGRNIEFQNRANQQASRRAAGMLEYTEIRAPFPGLITQRFLDPGALVQNAANSAQGTTKPVLALVNAETVRITVQVAEAEAPLVHPGIQATVRADALPGNALQARVTRTTGALDPATRTLLTEIDVPNHSHVLQPGMLVKVTLDLEAHSNTLTVPTSAVVFEKDKRSVFVVEGGKAKKVSVKTGFEGSEWVEVVQGLTGREEVIVTGKENVSSGGNVAVTSLQR